MTNLPSGFAALSLRNDTGTLVFAFESSDNEARRIIHHNTGMRNGRLEFLQAGVIEDNLCFRCEASTSRGSAPVKPEPADRG